MVLKERIDATEALIAIDLDNRRNELVAFDLVSGFQMCQVQTLSLSCKLQLCRPIRLVRGGGGQGKGAGQANSCKYTPGGP